MIFLRNYRKFILHHYRHPKWTNTRLNDKLIGNRAGESAFNIIYFNDNITYCVNYNQNFNHLLLDEAKTGLENVSLSVKKYNKTLYYVVEYVERDGDIVMAYCVNPSIWPFDISTELNKGLIQNPKRCLCGKHNKSTCCIM